MQFPCAKVSVRCQQGINEDGSKKEDNHKNEDNPKKEDVTCSFAYTCAELLSDLKLYCLVSSLLKAVVTTHTCKFQQTQIIFSIVIFHDDSLKGCVKSF